MGNENREHVPTDRETLAHQESIRATSVRGKNTILYFGGSTAPPRTGGQIYHHRLGNALKAKYNVVVEDGTAWQCCSRFMANWRFLILALRTQCDMVVEDGYSYYSSIFLANWLLRALGFKIIGIVQSIHDLSNLSPWRASLHKLVMMLFLRSANVIIANSNYTKAALNDLYWVPTHSVIVLPPAAQRLNTNVVRAPLGSENGLVLLSVANIEAKKGQKYLVEAMNYLADPHCCLYLVGGVKEPEYRDELLGLIEKYQLTHQVHMQGFLTGDELAQTYSAASIFVHPSLQEGYGMVLAEAMSCGLPIIATWVGAIPEIVTDGIDGILVPPGDARMLAHAIRRLCLDHDLRKELGISARRRWEEMPKWDRIEDEFCQVVQRVRSHTV